MKTKRERRYDSIVKYVIISFGLKTKNWYLPNLMTPKNVSRQNKLFSN